MRSRCVSVALTRKDEKEEEEEEPLDEEVESRPSR